MLTWQEYQEAVAFLYEDLSGVGRIQKNLLINDVDTGQPRQIDILLIVETKGHRLRIAIDAKYRKRKLSVKDVEEVMGLAQAVSADKAAIVAANGWSTPAKKKAERCRLDLRLLTPSEALSVLLEEWARIWDARTSALTNVFGPLDEDLVHSITPFSRGGGADVLIFRKYVAGVTYVTSDLTGPGNYQEQIETEIGNYELMICTTVDSEWAAGIISDIAPYTLEAALNPGDTMDMDFPNTSKLNALIFVEPELPPFRFWGREYGILLCVGITRSELKYARKIGSEALLDVLEQNDILPYTDFERESVI